MASTKKKETEELTEFIGQIRSRFGLTILLIEHHMDLVMDISDRIYVLDFGGKEDREKAGGQKNDGKEGG